MKNILTECEWFLNHYPRFGINHYPGDKIYVPKDKNVLSLLKIALIVTHKESRGEMVGACPKLIQDDENYFRNWFNVLGVTSEELSESFLTSRATSDEL